MKVQKNPTRRTFVSDKPDVTIITVVFNALKGAGEEALKACLDSVQAQTDANIEHLIIDGASTDGTSEYIRDYKNENHPIVFVSEPDKGIYDAMNKGIAWAKGDYCAFLNSDDFYHNPVGMRESVKRLRETGCDFSYAKVIVLRDGEVKNALHSHADGRLIFCSMPFSHQSMLFRTASLRKVGGYDVSYRSSSDYDLILRLILADCTACFVDCVFATFRVGGFSLQNIDTSQKECALIYSRLLSEASGYPLSPEKAHKMFVWKIMPRGLQYALIGRYMRSMWKWQPPLFKIEPPAKAERIVAPVRTERTDVYDWVDRQTPVWEFEECKRIFKEEDPQDTVWASDVWHLYSPYLYDLQTRKGVRCGDSLGVIFRIPDHMMGSVLRLSIALTSFNRPDMPKQRFFFSVNGKVFSNATVRRNTPFVCEMELPRETAPDGIVGVEIYCGDATCSPFFGRSMDMRPQAFLFSYAKVEKA